jgi:uncharacterized membrane protein
MVGLGEVMDSDEELQSSRVWVSQIRNVIIGLILIVTFWSVLNFVLPDGWWHLPINVIAFLYQFYLMESYIGPPALSLSKGAAIHDVARSNWYY